MQRAFVSLILAVVLTASVVLPSVAAADTLVGDVNGDCRVDLIDLTMVAHRYLTARGSLLYAPQFDLNSDGVINILDIQIVASHYLQHC